MTSEHDKLSRADLAVIIKAATEAEGRRSGSDLIDQADAERIAAEVGINPAEFRAAMRALRANRVSGARFLGPPGMIAAEDTLPRPVTDAVAHQLLAEGQSFVSLPGAVIEQASEGLWRLGDPGRGELQVATRGGRTRIAAIVDRRRAKFGLIAGSTLAGGFLGSFILTGAVFAASPTPGMLAVANLIGVVGGSSLGFLSGRTAWRVVATQTRDNVFSALERMRALASRLRPSEAAAQPATE
jgi:hypothetical protein